MFYITYLGAFADLGDLGAAELASFCFTLRATTPIVYPLLVHVLPLSNTCTVVQSECPPPVKNRACQMDGLHMYIR